MNRRMSSRTVSLTSTFLLLAAGGTAACDNDDDDATFYCADANGQVVDEDYCDDDDSYHPGFGGFFIWYSSGYRTGYPVGYRLPSGGNRFAYNDVASRTRFGLPATGRISNGTIKTGVVGKGGSGSSRTTSKSGG